MVLRAVGDQSDWSGHQIDLIAEPRQSELVLEEAHHRALGPAVVFPSHSVLGRAVASPSHSVLGRAVAFSSRLVLGQAVAFPSRLV